MEDHLNILLAGNMLSKIEHVSLLNCNIIYLRQKK